MHFATFFSFWGFFPFGKTILPVIFIFRHNVMKEVLRKKKIFRRPGRYAAVVLSISWILCVKAIYCSARADEAKYRTYHGRDSTGHAGTGADAGDSLLLMFWNLENFFDYRDQGTGSSDAEFSSSGQRKWTKSRFYTKCNAIAKTFLWIGDEYGRMPDMAGFAEIENRSVLNALLYSTALRKYDYGIVHYDSPDTRGIDVALVYRKGVFRKVRSRPVRVGMYHTGSRDSVSGAHAFRTRDILYVALEHVAADDAAGQDFCAGSHRIEYHMLVNHHPSKYGGAAVSVPKREAAMKTMLAVCDSLDDAGCRNVICMGDFNDTPDSPLFDFTGKRLVNMAVPLFDRGQGTIRYRGKRDLIDMFIVSEDVVRVSGMEICRVPFLTVWDNSFAGEKPFRTYSGPRYIGGVSDHCPILLKIHTAGKRPVTAGAAL